MTRIGIFFAAVLGAAAFIGAQSPKAAPLVTPKEAQTMIEHDSSVVVLDVRTADEYYGGTGHLPGAVLVPVQALEDRMSALDQYKDRPIIVYCRTGHRSTAASEILQKHGFHVRNLQGGITRWTDEGLPVIKENR